MALPSDLQSAWCRDGLIRAEEIAANTGAEESVEQAARLRLLLKVGALHPEFMHTSDTHHSSANLVKSPSFEGNAEQNAGAATVTGVASRSLAIRQLLSFAMSDGSANGESVRVGLNATQVAASADEAPSCRPRDPRSGGVARPCGAGR